MFAGVVTEVLDELNTPVRYITLSLLLTSSPHKHDLPTNFAVSINLTFLSKTSRACPLQKVIKKAITSLKGHCHDHDFQKSKPTGPKNLTITNNMVNFSPAREAEILLRLHDEFQPGLKY